MSLVLDQFSSILQAKINPLGLSHAQAKPPLGKVGAALEDHISKFNDVLREVPLTQPMERSDRTPLPAEGQELK